MLDQKEPQLYARRQINRAIDAVEQSKSELYKAIDRMNERHNYVYGEGVFRLMHDHELKRDYYDVKKTSLLREAYLNDFTEVNIGGKDVQINVFDACQITTPQPIHGGFRVSPITRPMRRFA